METNVTEIHAANERYAATFGDKGGLSHDPTRRFAVVTCMDCRLDPAKFAGIAEGDAHVIRNAGGRVSDDVIRSLLISYKMLGTNEWFVIQHTHCGMQGLTNEAVCARFEEDAAAHGGDARHTTLTLCQSQESSRRISSAMCVACARIRSSLRPSRFTAISMTCTRDA